MQGLVPDIFGSHWIMTSTTSLPLMYFWCHQEAKDTVKELEIISGSIHDSVLHEWWTVLCCRRNRDGVDLPLKNKQDLERCGRTIAGTHSLSKGLGMGMSRKVWETCLKSRSHVGIQFESEPDILCQASPPHPPTLFILALLPFSLPVSSSSLNPHDSSVLFSFTIFVTLLPHPESHSPCPACQDDFYTSVPLFFFLFFRCF